MTALGFEFYSVGQAGAAESVADRIRFDSDIGYSAIFEAAVAVASVGPFASRLEEYRSTLSDEELLAWNRAFSGDNTTRVVVETDGGMVMELPGNGCLADSRDAVMSGAFQDLVRLSASAAELSVEASDLADSHPYLVDVMTSWRACMRSNGFEVENRNDALGLAQQARAASGDMLSPAPEEQSLAGADLRCSAPIDQREAAAFTLAAAEQFLLLDNEGMLLEWGELRPAVRRALVATSVGTELAPVLR